MNNLDELASAALLGTARRPVDVTMVRGPAAEAIRALPSADDPARLLDTAALLSAARRGGVTPGQAAHPPLTPAGPEVVRRISPAAASRLAGLLESKDETLLLLEWLGAAAAGEWVVDPAALPALLDVAAKHPAVATAARPVLGVRGNWLASLRPHWRALIVDQSPELDAAGWEHGEKLERQALLRAFRRTDPVAGLAMLARTWSQEQPDDRAEFLRLLEPELGDGDEPFLEAALDDRRQEVRHLAAALLARLPGSRLSARMTERALAAIRTERKLMRTRLAVTPPQELGGDWGRDGVVAKVPAAWRGGQGAWLLRQIVSMTPLKVWTDLVNGGPADVLTTPVLDDWQALLVEAWTDATVAQRDEVWAVALLRHGLPARTADVLAVAPAAAREIAVVGQFAAGRTPEEERVLNLSLDALPRPWGTALTDAAIGWLARPGPGVPQDWHARERLRIMTYALAPVAAPRVRQVAEKHPDEWRVAISALADRLTFRNAMLEELR